MNLPSPTRPDRRQRPSDPLVLITVVALVLVLVLSVAKAVVPTADDDPVPPTSLTEERAR